MLKKFIYDIKIVSGNDTYELSNINNDDNEPFLRIDFEIIKSSYQQLNSGNIIIYNLSNQIRNLFCKSPIQTNKIIQVSLNIGFQTRNATNIWNGFLIKSLSRSENGNTIFFEMEGFDGGLNIENVYASFRINENATILDLKKEYANALGLDLNSKSVDDMQILKNGWSTNTKNVLQELQSIFKKEDIFIEDDKLHFLDEQYYNTLLKNNLLLIPKITEESGLIKTPINKGNTVEITTILNPYIKRGSLIELESKASIDKRFNGIYKVVGLKHQGSISYNYNGKNISIFELRTFNNTLLF